MDDEFERETQPSGALEPPSRKPPTTVGVATPGGGPRSRRRPVGAGPGQNDVELVGKLLNRTLDVVDELGDIVADALHLRPRDTRI